MFQWRGRLDCILAAVEGPQPRPLASAREHGPAGLAGPLQTGKPPSWARQRKDCGDRSGPSRGALPEGPDSDPSEAYWV